jgi:hypothetical protein
MVGGRDALLSRTRAPLRDCPVTFTLAPMSSTVAYVRRVLSGSARRRQLVKLADDQVVSFRYERTPEWWARPWIVYSTVAVAFTGTYVLWSLPRASYPNFSQGECDAAYLAALDPSRLSAGCERLWRERFHKRDTTHTSSVGTPTGMATSGPLSWPAWSGNVLRVLGPDPPNADRPHAPGASSVAALDRR